MSRFITCKRCREEYLALGEGVANCPKCGAVDRPSGPRGGGGGGLIMGPLSDPEMQRRLGITPDPPPRTGRQRAAAWAGWIVFFAGAWIINASSTYGWLGSALTAGVLGFVVALVLEKRAK
ncbi:MAG: hypothetical protein EPO35_03805 [Acidobacteria bacterium]|nr:MAG: hypothetical protein EPO35_03805 [Acidobacteriota bacterium]